MALRCAPHGVRCVQHESVRRHSRSRVCGGMRAHECVAACALTNERLCMARAFTSCVHASLKGITTQDLDRHSHCLGYPRQTQHGIIDSNSIRHGVKIINGIASTRRYMVNAGQIRPWEPSMSHTPRGAWPPPCVPARNGDHPHFGVGWSLLGRFAVTPLFKMLLYTTCP